MRSGWRGRAGYVGRSTRLSKLRIFSDAIIVSLFVNTSILSTLLSCGSHRGRQVWVGWTALSYGVESHLHRISSWYGDAFDSSNNDLRSSCERSSLWIFRVHVVGVSVG
jgi:hypothetical protein